MGIKYPYKVILLLGVADGSKYGARDSCTFQPFLPPRYRRMGVMGAVMIVQQLARQRDVTDLSLQAAMASQATLPPARKKQVHIMSSTSFL